MQIQFCTGRARQTYQDYTACTERTSRVVTYTKRAEHIQPILHNLHWLPINNRIEYKVATLAFETWSTGSPAYRLPAVSNDIPTRHLRSSSQLLLSRSTIRNETTWRSFNRRRRLPLSRIFCLYDIAAVWWNFFEQSQLVWCVPSDMGTIRTYSFPIWGERNVCRECSH